MASPESRPPSPEDKMRAMCLLDLIMDASVPLRGQLAAIAIAQELGISEEEAGEIVVRYSDAKARNEMPGGITRLPDTQTLPPRRRGVTLTEEQRRLGIFTLGYVEHAMGEEEKDFVDLGSYWLGNSELDSRLLMVWMEDHPKEVARYMEWAFHTKRDKQTRRFVNKFRKVAKKGTLKKVEFY